MPNLTKFDSVIGSSMSTLKSPRSRGPSTRAVMMQVSTPKTVIAICAPKTPSESRASAPCRRSSATAALPRRCQRRRRVQHVETEAARAQHRLALLAHEAAPERGDARLERIARGGEAGHVDRHVRDPEAPRRPGERRGRLDAPVVEQILLEVAREHEGPLDVVRVRIFSSTSTRPSGGMAAFARSQ